VPPRSGRLDGGNQRQQPRWLQGECQGRFLPTQFPAGLSCLVVTALPWARGDTNVRPKVFGPKEPGALRHSSAKPR
jgi:hypothetical protein